MKITVLYNRPSARFLTDQRYIAAEDDTEISAKEVAEALSQKGAAVTMAPLTESTIEQTIKSVDCDLVFNLIEWTGVDTVYAMKAFDALNAQNLRYTGATKENYRDTCDKLITKSWCKRAGFPTANWQEFVTGDEPITLDAYPALVKIASEHSSVGISASSIAHDRVELRRIVKKRIAEYHAAVFAETYLTGREFQVTLLERATGVTMLPPAEIMYAKELKEPILTYGSRWDESDADYYNSEVALADLSGPFLKKLDTLCVKAFAIFGFRDYARFDIRCDSKDHPYFLELNSNPGLGDDEEYGMTLSYKAVGMTFADFVWAIVESAAKRYSIAL